jgi:hypothetical protein
MVNLVTITLSSVGTTNLSIWIGVQETRWCFGDGLFPGDVRLYVQYSLDDELVASPSWLNDANATATTLTSNRAEFFCISSRWLQSG